MSAHTKEAWCVCGDAGDWSASHDGIGSSEYWAIKEGDEVVALVVSHTSNLFQPPPDTSPRAHLIAAAPDLLNACWNVVLAADDSERAAAKEQARAAIAKATPEAKP